MDNRSRIIRLKLTGKLMVVMAAILIFCQLLLSATHLYQSDKQLHQQHQARLDATLKTLAQSIAIDVWNFNAGSLEVLVGPHLTDPGIRKIALNDTNGNSLELPNQALRNSSDDAVLEKAVELTLGGQQTNVGMLRLYSNTDYIAAQLRQTMLRQTGELVLLILILAAGLSLALSKLVLQPLRKLNAALTAAVNSQDGIVHNPLSGLEDEFEEVAVSIAGLSGRLSGDIKTISQAKADLQAEKERTDQALNHLKQTQEALLQSEKQASLGSLVAGVAHEVNTPLGVVITSITCINDMVQQLLNDTEAGTLTKPTLVSQLDKLNEATHLIISNTNRASQLINNFKLLSQEQHGEAQRWFNLSSYIQDVVASMQDELAAHHIKLQLQIEPDIVVSSMPGLYAQLVSSLLSNVMEHAFPSGQGGNCLLRLALHPHEVCLSCSDQGVGIATELQKRVFDPFYTSKLGVGSSGLGMAIAYRIVKFNLKGDIQVHSVEQQGTTFDIRIPIMLRSLTSLLLLFAASTVAQTDIHGFGSVRAGKMLPKGENPKLVDMYAGDGLIWRDETLFALQTTTDLQDSLRLTMQMMAKGSDDFSAKLSLAFLSYQLNPDMQLNFGRIANPLFAQSDFQYVRYAHDYARLPKAVYWNFDFETIEGLSFEHKATVKDFAVKYRLITGDFSGKTFKSVRPEGVPIKLHRIFNGYLELSKDYWTVFGGAMQADGDGSAIDEQLIFPVVLPALAVSGASQAEKQQLLDALSMSKKARYYYFGGRLQFGDWKIEGEKTNYGILKSSDPRNTAHYVAVSRRFDPFILTYHHEWSMQDINNLGFLSDITHPVLRQIGTQVYQRLATPNRFSMDVLTLRYDLQPGVSFKIDYMQGRDRQPQVDEFRGFSFGVDFVF